MCFKCSALKWLNDRTLGVLHTEHSLYLYLKMQDTFVCFCSLHDASKRSKHTETIPYAHTQLNAFILRRSFLSNRLNKKKIGIPFQYENIKMAI